MKYKVIKIFKILILILICILSYLIAPNVYERISGILEKNKFNTISEEYIEKKEVNLVKELQKEYENEEIIGFLSMKNIDLNYPVTHTGNNTFYLNHGYDQKPQINGTIFMDMDNSSFEDKNIVLYGHRIASGTMFNHLPMLLDSDTANNTVIELVNENGDIKKFEIFSVFRASAKTDYRKIDFTEDADSFYSFLLSLRDLSEIETYVDIDKIESLITLSTCTYEKKDYRLVVIGAYVD